MKPIVTAFAQSPDRGRGLARDMAVRWALEEVGQPYDVRLLSFDQLKEPAHLALQPFGQIPTFEDDQAALFESAGIVLHIAERHGRLLPDDAAGRANVICWMFAATSTIEPPIVERSMSLLLESERSWHAERLAMIEDRIGVRLASLSRHLADRNWLGDAFSAGDLLMVAVLRRLGGSSLLSEKANLRAYVARAEARPAFQAAFAAQLAVFTASTE